MTTATAVKRGAVTESLHEKYTEIFHRKNGFMVELNVEREDQIELLGLSLVSGIDPLFLGDPGVGKTWMIELLLRLLEGAGPEDFFNTLVFKETPADDLLGMRSLPAMKEGRIERMTAGYLPTAVIAYVDEIFKASPTLTNSLLDIMAQRKLKVGATVLDCSQLLCMFFSSNELPEREDQQPMRDRIGLTNVVPPVRTPEGRVKVMKIQDEYQASASHVDLSDAPKLTLEEVRAIRTEVAGVVIPEAIFAKMNDAQEQFASAGHAPSQRRVGQMLMAAKAQAWAKGRGELYADDLVVWQHMAWNAPDHADSAKDIVLKFASAFAQKAAFARTALEPAITEIDKIKVELQGGASADDMLERGFTQMRELRSLRKNVQQDIEKGEEQGENTRELEDVLGEVKRAHDWLKVTLEGDDS